MMSRYLLLAAYILISFSVIPCAQSEIVILTSENPHSLEVANKIRLGIATPSVIRHAIQDVGPTDRVVALGNEALEKAKGLKAEIIVGSFINYAGLDESTVNDINIIYSDPSPQSIAHFIDLNFKSTKFGFITTKSESVFIDEIKSSLYPPNHNELITVEHNGDTFVALNKLTKMEIDILFIGNSLEIYKANNIRFVLESMFRKRIPVITSSKALVKAGAAASIAPDEDAVIRETYNTINQFVNSNEKVTYKRFIDKTVVDTNKSLIKILNVQIREDNN